jgi:hypothetical protein
MPQEYALVDRGRAGAFIYAESEAVKRLLLPRDDMRPAGCHQPPGTPGCILVAWREAASPDFSHALNRRPLSVV